MSDGTLREAQTIHMIQFIIKKDYPFDVKHSDEAALPIMVKSLRDYLSNMENFYDGSQAYINLENKTYQGFDTITIDYKVNRT